MGGNLTGADIGGLERLSATLQRIGPQVTGSVEALSRCVAALVNDAGWQGSAASAFKHRWDQDALSGAVIGEAIKGVAGIVEKLAAELAAAEKVLDESFAIALAHGVPVEPDGQPFTGPVEMSKAAEAGQYAQMYDTTMTLVNDARRRAITELQDVLAQIGPDQGLGSPQKVAVADVLTGLYTVPVGASARLRALLAQIRSQRAELKSIWRKLPKDTPEDVRTDLWEERRGLWARQVQADENLADAEAAASRPLLRALATPVSRLVPALEDDTRFLSRTLGDIPVLGVGLTFATIGFEMDQDMTTRHWSFWHALAADAPPNLAALGIETAIAALALNPEVTVPTAAVIAVAAAVGYGVGSFGYELTHVNWSGNIHDDGVVGGTLESFKDAGIATWQNDMYGAAKSSEHVAGKLWHDATSIF